MSVIKAALSRPTVMLTFNTANGHATAEEKADLFVRELGQEIQPYILVEMEDLLQ